MEDIITQCQKNLKLLQKNLIAEETDGQKNDRSHSSDWKEQTSFELPKISDLKKDYDGLGKLMCEFFWSLDYSEENLRLLNWELKISGLKFDQQLKILYQICHDIFKELKIEVISELIDDTEYDSCCGQEPPRFIFSCRKNKYDFKVNYSDGCESCDCGMGFLRINKITQKETGEEIEINKDLFYLNQNQKSSFELFWNCLSLSEYTQKQFSYLQNLPQQLQSFGVHVEIIQSNLHKLILTNDDFMLRIQTPFGICLLNSFQGPDDYKIQIWPNSKRVTPGHHDTQLLCYEFNNRNFIIDYVEPEILISILNKFISEQEENRVWTLIEETIKRLTKKYWDICQLKKNYALRNVTRQYLSEEKFQIKFNISPDDFSDVCEKNYQTETNINHIIIELEGKLNDCVLKIKLFEFDLFKVQLHYLNLIPDDFKMVLCAEHLVQGSFVDCIEQIEKLFDRLNE